MAVVDGSCYFPVCLEKEKGGHAVVLITEMPLAVGPIILLLFKQEPQPLQYNRETCKTGRSEPRSPWPVFMEGCPKHSELELAKHIQETGQGQEQIQL